MLNGSHGQASYKPKLIRKYKQRLQCYIFDIASITF